jgi:hypothetical protein
MDLWGANMMPVNWMSVGLMTLGLIVYLVFLLRFSDWQLRRLLADDGPEGR